jgi:hypothetical protein
MHLLRKIVAIVLIAGIIVPTGVVHFACDLPQILAHYEHHNREHESVSLMDFLVDHALKAHHPDADHPGHSGFPEHHHHGLACCTSVFVAYIPPSQPFVEWHPIAVEASESIKINRNREFSPSEFAASIWQPPQIS